jgi:prophage regulatory protein
MNILRKPALKAKIGVSSVHTMRLVKAGSFPQPVQLGSNSIGWIEAEIDDWLTERAAERPSVDTANADPRENIGNTNE